MPRMPAKPIIGFLNESAISRFWSYVDRKGDDECWPWLASTCEAGYGRFKVASYVQTRAHRVSLIIATGEEDEALLALHSCDNPICCNPSHLRWGTVRDNNADMINRGRHKSHPQAGFLNHNAKLREGDLKDVVTLLREGKNNKQIAAMMGVNHATISLIRLGKTFSEETMKLGWVPTPKFVRKSKAVSDCPQSQGICG